MSSSHPTVEEGIQRNKIKSKNIAAREGHERERGKLRGRGKRVCFLWRVFCIHIFLCFSASASFCSSCSALFALVAPAWPICCNALSTQRSPLRVPLSPRPFPFYPPSLPFPFLFPFPAMAFINMSGNFNLSLLVILHFVTPPAIPLSLPHSFCLCPL